MYISETGSSVNDYFILSMSCMHLPIPRVNFVSLDALK